MDRRQKIHWNKTETETDPQFYYHFIFDKDIKATQWGKGLQQVAGCNKKKILKPYLSSYTKINQHVSHLKAKALMKT